MDDDSDEVRTMAAWTLVNLGQKEEGLSCLRKLLLEGSQCSRFVHNTIDWMGEVAFPLIKEHKATSASEAADYHVSILGRSAALNGL